MQLNSSKMVTMTKSQQAEAVIHVLENMMLLPKDSNLSKALKKNKYTDIYNISTMTKDDLLALTYVNDNGFETPISHSDVGMLCSFGQFVAYCKRSGNKIVNYKAITVDEFDDFCIDSSEPFMTTTATPKRDPISEFKKGTKHDPLAYMVCKDESQWVSYECSLTSVAAYQDVDIVLNTTHVPSPGPSKDLFDEKQAYMYKPLQVAPQASYNRAVIFGPFGEQWRLFFGPS